MKPWAAGGLLLLLLGCSGTPNTESWQVTALTVAWDQPDGLAEYFHVRGGSQLVRVEERMATLYLTPGTHIVQIESCNSAGCSEPASVVITWRDGAWHVVPAGREDRSAPATPLLHD